MKYIIRYHNKPHNYRITSVHIIQICRGVMYVHADVTDRKTRERGIIECWGGDSYNIKSLKNVRVDSTSTYFSDAQERDIVAELRLLPETVEESKFMMLDRMSKDTYRAFLVSDKLFSRAWDRHDCTCRRKRAKTTTRRPRHHKEI